MAIGYYVVVSLSAVFLNHAVFTKTLTYPVFVTWFQQITGIPIYLAISYLGKAIPSLAVFPVWKPEWDIAVKVVPLSTLFALMISFSNICLKNVQVSTYQAARAPALLMNVIFSYLILGLL